MDSRAAYLQQETDDDECFKDRTIGMHNLRAKLREQLKGYTHIKGFPLESEGKVRESTRTESLNVRRDSIRRRGSSVTRQEKFETDDTETERKYRPRKSRRRDSLLIPRLLWFSVYVTLCYVAYKSMKYFSGNVATTLCHPCTGTGTCGVLDEEFVVPVDSLAGLKFGSVFPQKSTLQCRADVCVPGYIADPPSLCRVAADEALLYRTRHLLQDQDKDEEHSARFLEYFRRRAMREEGLAGALSPDSVPSAPGGKQPPQEVPPRGDQPPPGTVPGNPPTPTQPAGIPPPLGSPPPVVPLATPPAGSTAIPPAGIPPPIGAPPPANAPAPTTSGNLANGAYAHTIPLIPLSSVPAGLYSGGGGNCSTLRYAPAQGSGYCNLTTEYYKGYKDVENYAQCCALCENDLECVGWTRVCGGDVSVRNCYLKRVLELDPNPAAIKFNWQPKLPVYPPNPELRYTGGVPIMFESGTKYMDFPEWLYGCPYPPSANGICTVPPGCNCGGGVCYPACIAPPVPSYVNIA